MTTVAGIANQSGSVDASGSNARFGHIAGLVIDPSGTIIVSDAPNHTLRKVTPAGGVTTFAGLAGNPGYVDATGPSARFELPGALLLDRAGNLYVGQNMRIRKVTSAGAVTTLVAQPGLVGAPSDGHSDLAFNRDAVWGFGSVTALAVDSARNLYVGEFCSIRKIAFDSHDSIFAGQRFAQGTSDGVGTNAGFGMVAGLAMDAAGNFFVADSINHMIRKVTPAGVVTTLAGAARQEGFFDGLGADARFSYPTGIAVDRDGSVFVAETGNRTIRKITADGVVSTVAGNPSINSSPMDGVGGNAFFSSPTCLAFDSTGTLYIGDSGAVRKATSVATVARIVLSPKDQSAPAGQSATFSILANGNPAPGYQWQRQAATATSFVNLGNDASYSGTTTSVLVVSRLATTMTGDRFRCVVSNPLGTDTSAAATLNVEPPVVVVPLRVSTFVGRAGTNAGGDDGTGSAARFTGPMGVALDKDGNLYVADTFGCRVRKVSPAGVVTTMAGSGVRGSADGAGKAAQFGSPNGIAVDGAGNLYVTDGWNSCIRKITPAGVVTTLAGKAGERAYANGTGSAARFYAPDGIVIDRAGNLMVTDTIWLRRITPGGVVSGIDFYFTSTLDDAPLTDIGALVLDAADNIYVTCGQTVRKVTPAGIVTTVAGKHLAVGTADGRAINARFADLRGITLDATGNLYVADSGNHTIRKIGTNGMVTTVAGIAPTTANPDSSGSSDGIGSGARFKQPRGLVLDRAGTLYIADTLNNTIRKANAVDAVGHGEPVVFSVLAPTNATPSYQWLKDGSEISGATTGQLTIAAATIRDVGKYAVRVTTASAMVLSEPVKLSVDGVGPVETVPQPPEVGPPPVIAPPVIVPAPASRLVNLSIRAALDANAPSLIVGFVINGEAMPLLVRGVGPGLARFGVTTPIPDPRFAIYAGRSIVTENDDGGGADDVAAAAMRLGAFPLARDSRDAAVLATLSKGSFTIQCTAPNGSNGIVLVELYDAATTGNGRLVNVSARSRVGPNDDVMIAGFSISGNASRRVLIRAIGPSLRQFGVANALADPEVRIITPNDGRVIASNDNWGAASGLIAAFGSVGAFPLATDSRDAALVEELVPGTYTVVVLGVQGSLGEALVEIYELDSPL